MTKIIEYIKAEIDYYKACLIQNISETEKTYYKCNLQIAEDKLKKILNSKENKN